MHKIFQLIIVFVQFQFTISQIAFVIESLVSTFGAHINSEEWDALFPDEHLQPKHKTLYWVVSIGVCLIFSPLAWIRKIEVFRYGFIFGVAMIFITVLTIAVYCFILINERDWAHWEMIKDEYYAFNDDRYWDMIGFSFFMFEGIGCVMPVMNACDDVA